MNQFGTLQSNESIIKAIFANTCQYYEIYNRRSSSLFEVLSIFNNRIIDDCYYLHPQFGVI